MVHHLPRDSTRPLRRQGATAHQCRYWPDFAQASKEELPVKYLLSHQSGLAGIDERIPVEALYDGESIVGLLAAQKPWWPPGTRCGYHALTQGYLVGEVIRRITGRTVGGGSAVVIDRDARLSLAYVMNNCIASATEGDDRALSLGRALLEILDEGANVARHPVAGFFIWEDPVQRADLPPDHNYPGDSREVDS